MGEDRNGADTESFAGSKKTILEGPSEVVWTNDLVLFLLNLIMIPVCLTSSILIWLKDLLKRPKSLKGRVCLVTGAGRGFGRELCLALAKEGAILACADINSANNEETVRLVQAAGAKAKAYTVNVAVKNEVEETIAKAEEELGPIYLLVNNAAIIMPIAEPNEEYIRAMFNVNVLGYIWATEAVLLGMIKRMEGHILNISSFNVFTGGMNFIYYAASKAAVTSYAQSVRYDLLIDHPNTNIRITTIHPYMMKTSEDYTKFARKGTPLMDPKDVAQTAINAVKYNKEEVIIPRAWTLGAKLFWFAPTSFKAANMAYFLANIKSPCAKDLQRTRHGDIISSSNLMEKDKKNL